MQVHVTSSSQHYSRFTFIIFILLFDECYANQGSVKKLFVDFDDNSMVGKISSLGAKNAMELAAGNHTLLVFSGSQIVDFYIEVCNVEWKLATGTFQK